MNTHLYETNVHQSLPNKIPNPSSELNMQPLSSSIIRSSVMDVTVILTQCGIGKSGYTKPLSPGMLIGGIDEVGIGRSNISSIKKVMNDSIELVEASFSNKKAGHRKISIEMTHDKEWCKESMPLAIMALQQSIPALSRCNRRTDFIRRCLKDLILSNERYLVVKKEIVNFGVFLDTAITTGDISGFERYSDSLKAIYIQAKESDDELDFVITEEIEDNLNRLLLQIMKPSGEPFTQNHQCVCLKMIQFIFGAFPDIIKSDQERWLHRAIILESGSLLDSGLVRFLVEGCKVDLDVVDSMYNTPLHYAAALGNVSAIETLLRAANTLYTEEGNEDCTFKDAIINACNVNGNTPLHACVIGCDSSAKSLECIRLLLDAGANSDVLNNDFLKPGDMASGMHLGDVEKILGKKLSVEPLKDDILDTTGIHEKKPDDERIMAILKKYGV